MQLQIEQQALGKETDDASKEQLKNTDKQLAELQEQDKTLTAQWEADKGDIDNIKQLKEITLSTKLNLQKLHGNPKNYGSGIHWGGNEMTSLFKWSIGIMITMWITIIITILFKT